MDIPKRLLSYALGFTVGLLIVAPPIGYSIPVMVNSYSWLFMLIVSGLLGTYLLYTKIPLALKILSVYLFAGCFISEVPYISFNAYILVVAAMYAYLAFLKCDFKIVLKFVAAAFLFEVILTVAQLFGRDTMMNFGRQERLFLGTIMQYMRFSSVLAVMVPLLIIKNKKFIFPVIVFCLLSHSSTFALALAGGGVTYIWMIKHKFRWLLTGAGVLCAAGYLCYDHESLLAELQWGRWTVWPDIIKTWCFDTKNCVIPIARTYADGPIDWKAIFFGRGLDTFLPLFPVYKHDPNPFPQAHCMYLQWLWEIGVVGASLLIGYVIKLMWRTRKDALLISGLVCIGVVGIFTFPDRMTQSMMLMVAFIAYCEQRVRLEPNL